LIPLLSEVGVHAINIAPNARMAPVNVPPDIHLEGRLSPAETPTPLAGRALAAASGEASEWQGDADALLGRMELLLPLSHHAYVLLFIWRFVWGVV
jgi:hypothetical protein